MENHVLHVQTKRCEATPVANENTLNKTGGKNACNRIYINRSEFIELLDKGILTVNQSYLQIQREEKEKQIQP